MSDKHSTTRLFKYFISSLLILLLVWSLGPYLAINGQPILASFVLRIIISVAIILPWVAFGIWWLLHKQLHKQSQEKIDPATLELLNTLRERFKSSIQFAKKIQKRKFWQSKKSSWVLLLGSEKSGKTTLLANTGITLQSSSKQSLEEIKPTNIIDWWVKDDAIFLDPAGKYALPPLNEHSAQYFWEELLQLCKRHRGKHFFNHIVLAIDFPTLAKANEDELHALAQRIMQHLHIIKSWQKSFPASLIITQCDRLSGFNEFFDHLSPEERELCLGFALEHPHDKSQSTEIDEQFQKLLQNINEQLIHRLHYQQNIDKRSRIEDFPQQIQRLSQIIETLLNQIAWNQNSLQGIYFTSSLQKDNILDLLDASFQEAFHLVSKPLPARSAKQKPFFIASLFKQLSDLTLYPPAFDTARFWKRLTGLGIATIVVMALTFTWHYTYRQNVTTFKAISEDLNQPPKLTTTTVRLPWLYQLNRLQRILQTLQRKQTQHSHLVGFSQNQKLQRTTYQAYAHLLTVFMQPYMTDLLSDQIRDGISGNKLTLYDALRVYLMLQTPSHFKTIAVKHWFARYWQQYFSGNKKIQRQLMQHLNMLLTIPNTKWQINQALVQEAQRTLRKLPLADIAYLTLQGEYTTAKVSIFPQQKPIPGLNLQDATVPSFYSAENFQRIYYGLIPNFNRVLNDNRWLLGNAYTTPMTPTKATQISSQLKELYIHYYSKAWMKAASQIKLQTPATLKEVQAQIILFTDPSSALMRLLKFVTDNANLSTKPQAVAPQVRQAFNTLSKFSRQQGTYQSTLTALNGLAAYINKITEGPKFYERSYDAATTRIQNKGENDAITQLLTQASFAPQPVKTWLTNIASNTWKILLENAGAYLNTIWKQTVWPEYEANISGRYPIDKNSAESISVANFTRFFGPGGTIGTFFNYYLKPFVNINEVYWTWNKLNGQSIGVSQNALDMFIRASLIQQMFYTNNPSYPSMRFSLMLVNASPQITSVTMNIGGESLTAQPSNKTMHDVEWPGKSGNFVTLSYTTQTGKTLTKTHTGYWAWLRLLDNSQVKLTTNPRSFIVTFTLDNYFVTYQMIAGSRINPSLPNILHVFKLPKVL